jgi:tetraacyldisaccharide 4'-kinase
MNRIKKNIERVITSDNNNRYGWFAPVLSMASKVYGGAAKLRRVFYKTGVLKSKRLPCFIVSIGNIAVGGTGKTPMAMYVAETAEQLGYKAVIVSRGYKGKAETIGGVVSDGRNLLMTPEAAGDEPYMMAARLKNVPVVVGKDRFKAGRLAIREFNPDVLVLDDGFQHSKLQRDLDLVLLDYRKPFGNGHLLPRGVLREPVSALFGADAIILTKSEAVTDGKTLSTKEKFRFFEGKTPVYRAVYDPLVYKVIKGKKKKFENVLQRAFPPATARHERAGEYSSESIKGRTVFAFSGLADNYQFRRTVEGLKCKLSGFMGFPDHHSYTEKDLKNILAAAQRGRSDGLVTTEKDYVRFASNIEWSADLFVIGIDIDFGPDRKRFNDFIKGRIEKRFVSDENVMNGSIKRGS